MFTYSSNSSPHKTYLFCSCKKVLVILRYFYLLFIILINYDTKNIIDIGEVYTDAIHGREIWMKSGQIQSMKLVNRDLLNSG